MAFAARNFTIPSHYSVGLLKQNRLIHWNPTVKGSRLLVETPEAVGVEINTSSFCNRVFYYQKDLDPSKRFLVHGWANGGWCYVEHDDFVSFPSRDAGFVYFIEAEGLNRYKIGYTNNPVRRIEEFKKACPCSKLILRALSPLTPYYKQIEAKWHRLLSNHRIHGEWFDLDLTAAIMIAGRIAMGSDLGDISIGWLFESWDDVLHPERQLAQTLEDLNQLSVAIEHLELEKRGVSHLSKAFDLNEEFRKLNRVVDAYISAIGGTLE